MTGKLKILIADDDVAAQDDWRETLAAWNYDVSFAEDGDKALGLLESLQPHVLLCDLRMPRRNGLDLLAAMKERGLNIATLMISGVGQIDDAVRAIKLGAYDYLTKPVDLDRLEILLKNLTSHVKLSEENQRLRRHLADAGKLGSIIGRSLPMRRVPESEEAAAKTVREQWPNGGMGGSLTVDLPTPAHFEAVAEVMAPEKMTEDIILGPSLEKHIDGIRKYIDAGFDYVYVHQLGPDQSAFIDFYTKRLLPKLS